MLTRNFLIGFLFSEQKNHVAYIAAFSQSSAFVPDAAASFSLPLTANLDEI